MNLQRIKLSEKNQILKGYILYDSIYICWNDKIMKWKTDEWRLVAGRC